MAHFMARQCRLSKIPFPDHSKRWVNVRKVFANHYKKPSRPLDKMLDSLGLKFVGRKHSGIDDTRNIANVLVRMLEDGANPASNERISWSDPERKCWNGLKCGWVRVLYNKPSDGLNLSDSDGSDSENHG